MNRKISNWLFDNKRVDLVQFQFIKIILNMHMSYYFIHSSLIIVGF